jgi:hypothetical protein
MRRILLWASRNRWLKARLPRFGWVRRATRRFMPGETAEDAIDAAVTHQAWGIDGVFTLLGENLTDLAEAVAVADAYHALIDEIAARGLDGEISLKLTQLGFDLDAATAFEHFDGLAGHSAERGSWVWIDMEGSAYTESTIALTSGREQARERRHLPAGVPPSVDIQRLLPATGHPPRQGCLRRAQAVAYRSGRRSTARSWRSRPNFSRPSAMTAPGSWRPLTMSRSSTA